MNFDFSEQQKLIQSEARKFLKQQCDYQRVRRAMEGNPVVGDPIDPELWQSVSDLGWPAMAIPQQYGGVDLGYLEMCVLAMELGRSLAPVPFSTTLYLFAELIKAEGSDQQKQQRLPAVADGSSLGCLAISEAPGDNLQTPPQCKVVGGRVSGKKISVVDGHSAHWAIISACAEDGNCNLYLVDLLQQEITRTVHNSIDLSRPTASLHFDGAIVEPIGEPGHAVEQLQRLYDKAAVLMAFEQVGGCEAAIKMGLAYTNNRYAFGRQVASFQAIKHKFADMYVAKELALGNAYYAAWALSADSSELPVAAATARVSAIDAYFLCSKENLQAHGGMGYTWEFDCHLHYRRAQHLSLILGSSHYWKDRLSTLLVTTEG